MNTALHHRFEGGINLLLAVTLSVIAIGSGILIWEWHGAHSSANHKHAKSASHHQHAKTHHTADAGDKAGKAAKVKGG